MTVDVKAAGTSVLAGSPATLTPFANSGDGGGTVAAVEASPDTSNPKIDTTKYDIASGVQGEVTVIGTGGTATETLTVVLTFQRL